MTITRRAVLTGGLGLAFLPLRPRLASAQAATPVRETHSDRRPALPVPQQLPLLGPRRHPDGVIATDPINADAARWLKAEIAQRFGKPIRYVVYSHDHADHISGGEVFADTAQVVAHENARRTIVAEKRPTAVPQVTFSDRMVIELGGTTVELLYVGRNHSDNSIVMRFPKERVLFAVDCIPVKSVGFRDWPDAYIEDWIESLRRVEAMDFDVLVPGHGPVGTKADVRAFREYMEELRDEVPRSGARGQDRAGGGPGREAPQVRELGRLQGHVRRSTWPACTATSSRTAARTDLSGVRPSRHGGGAARSRRLDARTGTDPLALRREPAPSSSGRGSGRWRRRLCAGPRARARPRLRHRPEPGAAPARLVRNRSCLDPLRRARRRAPEARLVQARAEALPFRDRAFDTVVSGLVFCSVDDPARGSRRGAPRAASGRNPPDARARPVRASAPGAMAGSRRSRLWTRVSGGCRPNRDTERTVEGAGFADRGRSPAGAREHAALRGAGRPGDRPVARAGRRASIASRLGVDAEPTSIQVVRDSISLDDLRAIARDQFGEMVKAVVDVAQGVMAIDGKLHADEETVLLDQAPARRTCWASTCTRMPRRPSSSRSTP